MKNLVIYGASGFAKETAHLIEEINLSGRGKWKIIGFIDDFRNEKGIIINGYPLMKFEDIINDFESLAIVIAVGLPQAKKKIKEKLNEVDNIYFPTLIHPNVKIPRTTTVGYGSIICEGAVLTTNITIGNFVVAGVNSTIGHDSVVMDFTTILPNASVSGDDILSEAVYFGTNATMIEKLKIGRNSIIGAGSVVIRDIPENCTAVGNPAKLIKYHN
ncbi:acetyltransferase [Planococcus sp. 1R117A]|uniref:acetyltransferase n=1 Tax=Planococcus sp. 1R117A TaxID=3447020 RepID=UPI003EDBD00F